MKSLRLSPLAGQVLAIVLAVVGVGASYWYYAKNSEQLKTATENLSACRALAAQIAEAGKSPQRARLESWSLDDLGRAVEKGATDAQLAADRVLRIDPQAAKRLGKSDYLEQATEVELLAVTLRQIIDFLYNVTHSDDQLQIGTLRLRMPHETNEPSGQELWLADIVLTQRIYAPTTAGR
jgi:type VI protein secretion system component VasK